MTFNLWGLAPLIRCHELLTLSASFTESTVSTRWRLGTPGAQRQVRSLEGQEGGGHLHSPRSLLTLFFWRWPIKCHLISGQEPKIWRHKDGERRNNRRRRCEPTRGSEAFSSSSLTCRANEEPSGAAALPPQPLSASTHVVFSKVALPLFVGLHHHVWRFGLADGNEARQHRRQRLKIRRKE